MLLDRHGNGEKAQILHVGPFGHGLEGIAHIAAKGAFVRDYSELRGKRVLDLLRNNLERRSEGVADLERADHKFDRAGQLFLDHGHAYASLR